MTTDNKFKNGDVVSERIRPALKLMIKRFANSVYYCQVLETPVPRELVYFERELIESSGRETSRVRERRA